MRLKHYEQVQPIAGHFFQQALLNRSLAHAYVLKGRSMEEMYGLALTVAKVLNCDQPVSATEPCEQCSNCLWIQKNSHPAVITISRLTYLVNDKGEDVSEGDLHKLAKKATQQTQIKAEQIQRLIGQLGLSSQYCRVIIFTDAEERSASTPSKVVPPSEWQAMHAGSDKTFHLLPLERSLFNVASANRFLKTLEEPPPNTLFFFLTDSEENLLETIVSRCQVVPFLTLADPDADRLPEHYRSFFNQLVARIPQSPDFYPVVAVFQEFMVEQEGLSLPQALEVFQTHLRNEWQHQDVSLPGFRGYRHWQKQIEKAKSHLDAKTNAEQTLNYLFCQLSQSRLN